MTGTVEGRALVIGSHRIMSEAGIGTAAQAAEAEALRAEGGTVIFVAIDGRVAGLLVIADPVKQTTPRAIESLKAAESGW